MRANSHARRPHVKCETTAKTLEKAKLHKKDLWGH